MSVEQDGVIDIISTHRLTGEVTLTISDHLDWSDSIGHQEILQRKLNRYLAFIESGEILEQYPTAKDRAIAIEVVFQTGEANRGKSRLRLPHRNLSQRDVQPWLIARFG